MYQGGLPRPRKRFGQHFLRDTRILTRIADALEITPTDTVVEIGPGRGALTEILAKRAGKLVAVEVDRDLAAVLRVQYATDPRVSIIEQDVLKISLAEAAGTEDFLLVGNVPYYITTPILFHALERPRAKRSVYLVQKEVAERIVSPPGSKEYGALSVNVQALATAEMLFTVPAGAFQPPPKVESAVIRIIPRANPAVPPEDEARFSTMVQEMFSLRRKQLRRVVRTVARLDAEGADAVLGRAGLDPEIRPETLAPDQFVSLMRAIQN